MPAVHIFAVAVLIGAAGASAQAPPRVTGVRVAEAFKVLEEREGPLSYTLAVRSVVSKTDGSDRKESESLEALTRDAKGATTVKVLKATREGRDVTAEAQRDRDERLAAEASARHDGGDEISVGLVLPTGEDAGRFEFGPATRVGSLLTTSFRPTPAHRGDENIAEGTLAWDPTTHDPAWLEAVPVDLPRGASELKIRFEFARAGGLLYPARTVTDGVGGILWIKRRFQAEIAISDLRAGNAPSSTPAGH
ncbi:MAG: hypothetical protein ACOY3Y_01105 [Acidobacteriota bacterium]